MKAFTDIEQSKKLAEFLPLESADCFLDYDEMQKFHRISWFEEGFNKESQLRLNENNVCAWSLVALLNAVPQIKVRGSKKIGYVAYYNKNITTNRRFDIVDACYEMILKLHEQKLL